MTGMVVVSLSGANHGFSLNFGVEDETPIFLAVEVSFRVASEEIKKGPSFCFGGRLLGRK